MKWIGISGSRKINAAAEKDVRREVKKIFADGNSLVSGGALGVDFMALDEALKYDPEAKRIKIFLPTTLEKYTEHYRKHAKLGDIISEEAENLIAQLMQLKKANSSALVENRDTNFTEENKKERYYERNSKIVEVADKLLAFRITNTGGTQDAIHKAEMKGILVQEFTY